MPLLVDLEREWRGGQHQALLLLRGLRACGHPAELVALRGRPLARRARWEGIPVHEVGDYVAPWQAALVLRRLLARRRFDLVHANEPWALTATWLTRAHRRLPVVVARRVAYPLSKAPFSLRRYRAARRIIAVSRFVASSVEIPGLPGRVEVVYDGVEVPPATSPEARRQARARWGVQENEPLLGCVGYLLPEKGQELLIRALPELRAQYPSCRLLLAGAGRSRKQLESLAHELHQDSAVHFAGFIEDTSEVYTALDVFVFPSLAEPLGSSLLAAMAHALPIVAVARGGVPEIVENGLTGLLVADPEPAEIAAAVFRLLRDPDLARRLSQAARAKVLQSFTADHMVENTLRVYEQLASRPATV